MAIGLVVGAIVVVAIELPINASADWWALLCLVFAASTWANAARRRIA